MPPDREDQLPGRLRARRASAPRLSASQDKPAAPLPDHVSQNIEAIQALHIRADENLSRYQRPIETVSSFLGRPAFFYGMVLLVTGWVLSNVFSPRLAVAPFDPAPFVWLQGLVGLGALLTAIIVLITQTRQGKLAEQRAQLELQVSLLAEQKTAKLIALIEELRRDLPEVTNRHDAEAAAMEQSTAPHALLDALETVQERVQAGAGREHPDKPDAGEDLSPAGR
jgi:uncharacterized membrane protein